jgi:hypothetical protein
MQDAGFGLPRIRLLGTSVNRAQKKAGILLSDWVSWGWEHLGKPVDSPGAGIGNKRAGVVRETRGDVVGGGCSRTGAPASGDA